MAKLKVSKHRKKSKTPKRVFQPRKEVHQCVVCGRITQKPYMILADDSAICSSGCLDEHTMHERDREDFGDEIDADDGVEVARYIFRY
ncbi:hypothetical protein HGB24_03475 [Candidatus Saccharibacteria bacterium]|nr:hypothetical protein [Candidatus Saccharibacteria bacterium]